MHGLSIRALAAPLVTLALTYSASAQSTWYVDVHGTAPGTGTQVDPYTSLQYAIEQPGTVDNDTLLVAPGTYTENLRFLATPHDSRSINIIGTAGASRTVIRPAAPGHLLEGFRDGVWLFQGLTFTGVQESEHAVFHVNFNGSSITVDDCVIADNEGYGVLGAYDMFVNRTTITNNGVGLDALVNFTKVHVHDSIIWGNDDDVGFVDFLFLFWSDVGPELLGQSEDSISEDPLFVDPARGDYHLQAGSPCIIGDVNPSGADLGAFPYDSAYVPDLSLYCVGGLNSVGTRGRIGIEGSSSVSADELTLTITGCVPGNFGIFFYGSGTTTVPFGGGSLCVNAGPGGLYRLPPPQALDAQGKGSHLIDFNGSPAGAGPGTLLPGSTWNFQYWYRDPQGLDGSGFNLSNAMTLRFWE